MSAVVQVRVPLSILANSSWTSQFDLQDLCKQQSSQDNAFNTSVTSHSFHILCASYSPLQNRTELQITELQNYRTTELQIKTLFLSDCTDTAACPDFSSHCGTQEIADLCPETCNKCTQWYGDVKGKSYIPVVVVCLFVCLFVHSF